ncbi:MAG: glycosyltransferase [Deltaproteobacteria bacterium]|nr:glycosyltransferase [Deltaproteobacteria bacterium]
MNPLVSIIIPVKEINNYIRESIPNILNLDYENFEVVIFPDSPSAEIFPKTTIIPTGKIGPAEKRDLALKYAKGEIFAFLDDDAYPRKDWLSSAVRHFEDKEVAGVGGPAVTPRHDSAWQRASGGVFSSWLASGGYEYRYVPRENVTEVDDYPTVNLLVRRDIFEQVGGFDTNYWPGEDTKLCLDITKKLGKKIKYEPDALVYHHRRPLFRSHLQQVGRYAFHRGYFVKVLPETSLRLQYFVPSLFLVGLIIGALLSPINEFISAAYLTALAVYIVVLLATVIAMTVKEKDIIVAALAVPGIFLTHVVYGYNFLKGLSARR